MLSPLYLFYEITRTQDYDTSEALSDRNWRSGNGGTRAMTRHTQLSPQVHLVEVAEHLRQVRETVEEKDRERGDELDTIISDIELVSDLANRTDGAKKSHWHEKQSTHR